MKTKPRYLLIMLLVIPILSGVLFGVLGHWILKEHAWSAAWGAGFSLAVMTASIVRYERDEA